MGDRSVDAVTYLPASLLRRSRLGRRSPCRGATRSTARWSWPTSRASRRSPSASPAWATKAPSGSPGSSTRSSRRMLKTASCYGGDTLTFGGDAILLLFDGPEHASRAVAAALAMLRQVERAAAVDAGDGKVKIGMSVGAHSGAFLLAAAGRPEERAHLFVLGRGAELTALAEAQAERGQLAVSSIAQNLLPGGQTRADRRLLEGRRAPAARGLAPRGRPRAPSVSAEQLRQLAPVPASLRQDGVAKGDGAGAAHAGTPSDVDRLREHPRPQRDHRGRRRRRRPRPAADLRHHAHPACGETPRLRRQQRHRHQGSKLVIAFGAPVAHEYAAANAARFALDLTPSCGSRGSTFSTASASTAAMSSPERSGRRSAASTRSWATRSTWRPG